jgi:hypothetical protein
MYSGQVVDIAVTKVLQIFLKNYFKAGSATDGLCHSSLAHGFCPFQLLGHMSWLSPTQS